MTKSEAINQLIALAVCSIQNQGIECAEYCPFSEMSDDCLDACNPWTDESIAEAVKTLRAQQDNTPLTPDELRQMESDNDGTPIWIKPTEKYRGEWTEAWYIWPWDAKNFKLDTYSEWWIAYRSKPEGSEG